MISDILRQEAALTFHTVFYCVFRILWTPFPGLKTSRPGLLRSPIWDLLNRLLSSKSKGTAPDNCILSAESVPGTALSHGDAKVKRNVLLLEWHSSNNHTNEHIITNISKSFEERKYSPVYASFFELWYRFQGIKDFAAELMTEFRSERGRVWVNLAKRWGEIGLACTEGTWQEGVWQCWRNSKESIVTKAEGMWWSMV